VAALSRNAQEDDAEAIAGLLGELGYPATRADARQRLMNAFADPSARVFVAELEGSAVGLLAAHVIPYFPDGSRILRITALVVATSHRRRGVGNALLDRALELASSFDCAGVELTAAEHRREAHAFYEQLGFERTSFRFFRPIAR